MVTQSYAIQAIETKYIGPTNHRGSRVKATCEAGSITVEWADNLNVFDNHRAASLQLAAKLGWTDHTWIGGATQNGYCFVAAPSQPQQRTAKQAYEHVLILLNQVNGGTRTVDDVWQAVSEAYDAGE